MPISNYWTTSSKALQPRSKIPLVIPAFSYTDLQWLATSRVVFEVDFELEARVTLKYPIRKPTGANFVLAVRLSDGSRYKLWDHEDDDLHYPLYGGQLLTLEFSIEIWTVEGSECSSDSDIDILTNSTELDVCCSPGGSEYLGTTDTTIFSLIDITALDPDELLIFEEELPTSASAVPDAPVLSGVVVPPYDISLTWTDVSGETSYKLYRSSDGVTYALIAT